jgi:NIMA-interacting peptidyl-prolyl cis-trans isomerase 1
MPSSLARKLVALLGVLASRGALAALAALTALTVMPALVACSGTQTSASANTASADQAHLAAQATEPRSGDATASQPAGGVPLANAGNVKGGGTTAPPPPSSRATAANEEENPKRIGARHVLIQWMGSDRAGKSVLRTKEQALALAQEVLKRAKAGEDIGRLAVEYSDEPNAGARGGSLGRFSKGQMVGAFEAVAFKLKVGEISDIVETPFGYHIIQRTE